MSDEAEKITRIQEILQAEVSDKSFEAVSLALSIRDEEDRNLQLYSIAHWLIKNNDWQKAFGVAQLMSESYEKSEALQEVADCLASVGHLEKAIFVFSEAEKASTFEHLSAWQQSELLHQIAKSLRKIKAVFRADEVWSKAILIAQKGEESADPQESLDCSSVLAEIAENFASEGRIEQAFNLARTIKSIGKRESTLNKISDYSQQTKKVA